MATITDVSTLTNEVVLTERVVSTEFKIVEIQENIRDRVVRVNVELGPFVTETGPGGRTETRSAGRRSVVAWQGDAYDAVRDTWRNADLLAQVTTVLQAG